MSGLGERGARVHNPRMHAARERGGEGHRKRTRRRTVPQSFNHRNKRRIERVAIVVYAYSVYVEHPGCFVWVDGEGGEGEDVGSVGRKLNLGWRSIWVRVGGLEGRVR